MPFSNSLDELVNNCEAAIINARGDMEQLAAQGRTTSPEWYRSEGFITALSTVIADQTGETHKAIAARLGLDMHQ